MLKSRIERKADLKMNDKGDLEGKITITFTGLESADRRAEERFADDAARRKYLEDEVREWVAGACEVELLGQPDWKGSSPSMVASFSLKMPAWALAAGRRFLMPAGIFGGTEKHMFEHADREHPVYFRISLTTRRRSDH